jgi:hypothetical protein
MLELKVMFMGESFLRNLEIEVIIVITIIIVIVVTK